MSVILPSSVLLGACQPLVGGQRLSDDPSPLILLFPPTSKMPHPLTADLDHHDRKSDDLIDYIHTHAPTEPTLPTWALEALAG